MSFDDNDFLPEMLQYFDDFCSRIDDDNKSEDNVPSHSGPPNDSISCARTDSTQSSVSLRGQHMPIIKMIRKTSFGKLCGDISSSQLSIFAKVQATTEENLDWKKRFEELQRQYDMKCGELTNTAETANQRSNALLATIRNLETLLNNERIESSKTINALRSQLSFKEADYRLITTELQNCKNLLLPSQSAFINKETFPLLTQVPNCEIASPGSYLLAQEADRVEANYSTRAGPLPRAVSPVVTRGPPAKRPRFYSDDPFFPNGPVSQHNSGPRFSIPLPDFSEAANPPTPIRSRAMDANADDAFIVAPSPPFRSPSIGPSRRKPENSPVRMDSESAVQNLAIPRSQTPEPEYGRLNFRLRRRKKSSKADEIFRSVLGKLTSLMANTRSLTRDPELPGIKAMSFDVVNLSSKLIASQSVVSHTNFVATCHHTRPWIANFGASMRPRKRSRLQKKHWQVYETPPEESTISNNSESFNLEHLAENPFAGAPASQLVSVPSCEAGL
ncbi:hypothetical protein Aperf_G00000025762 [Anoplocephala perfoliata]